MSTKNPATLTALRKIKAMLDSFPPRLPDVAYGVPYEDLLVCYGSGTGRFTQDHTYLNFEGEIYLLNGERDGAWEGVYEVIVPVARLGESPPPAEPPYNRPVGPVNALSPQGYTKGRWTFADGSAVTAVGAALLHTAELLTGATTLWISAEQIMSDGTGRFRGQKESRLRASPS
jgi:hypothetical protein